MMALLLHLQRHGGATATDLARALEVSVRTVYRDVAALSAGGVPVWTEPGPGGGIRLLPGWRTTLDGLTGDEVSALFLGGAPNAAADLGLAAVLAAAQVKVLATLPPQLRDRATQAQARFHVDAPGWFHRDERVPHLAAVAAAVRGDYRLDIRYRSAGHSGGREVARRLDPLGLVLKAGVWYLVARHGEDVRTYRVGRITAAVATRERFDRPLDFDLAATWARVARAFDRTLLRETVTVRLHPAAARHLATAVGNPSAEDGLAGATTDEDGWLRMELAVESLDVARSQLTMLAPDVEVVAPHELRAALAATGEALAARNGRAAAHPSPNMPGSV
jgi:predicted DNA-binding transcriptional regulator YafY